MKEGIKLVLEIGIAIFIWTLMPTHSKFTTGFFLEYIYAPGFLISIITVKVALYFHKRKHHARR